jgi:hypothetical protein
MKMAMLKATGKKGFTTSASAPLAVVSAAWSCVGWRCWMSRGGAWRGVVYREGVEGIAALHALIADHVPEEWVDPVTGQVAQEIVVGIETGLGSWVSALVATGYRVFAINPLQAAVSGTAFDVGGEVGSGGCASAGGDGAPGSGASPSGRPVTASRRRR